MLKLKSNHSNCLELRVRKDYFGVRNSKSLTLDLQTDRDNNKQTDF